MSLIKSTPSAIRIYIRMRPRLFEFEDEEAWRIDSQSVFSIQRDQSFIQDPVIHKRRYADTYYNYQFKFDNVFAPTHTTDAIYEQCCSQLIKSVLQGYNATIFMYGQTTSGKTYTMLGDNQNPGILCYSLMEIFRELETLPGVTSLSISYLEIYNEQINDLLNAGSQNLKIHDDQRGQSFIQQLRVCVVSKFEEALALLHQGEEHRAYREKSMHEHSSRSHTIFQIKIERVMDGQKLSALLNLVDLAGSERLNEDEVVKNETNCNEETGYINKSLFALSNVINKLAEGKKQNSHIPYRDSKLTRFLSNSLGGNSLTAIVCTISPAAMNFYQTLSTLRFATRAKKVQNKVGINETKDNKSKTIESYEQQLLEKQQELEQLRRERDQLKLQRTSETNTIGQFATYLNLLMRVQEDKDSSSDQQEQSNSCLLFQQESIKICDRYDDELSNLQQKYRKFLTDTAKSIKRNIEIGGLDIATIQNHISQQISSQSIFNEIYVNAILNPSSDVLQDPNISLFEVQELLHEAYNEATKALQDRHQEFNTCLQDVYQSNILTLSTKLSASQSSMALNQLIMEIRKNCEWLTDSKDQLLEQYKKKIGVLEQAYLDVDQKVNKLSTKDMRQNMRQDMRYKFND